MHWVLAFGGLAGLLALVILIWNQRPRRQLRLRRAEVIELEARSRLALASAQESRQCFEDLVEQSPAVVEFYDTTETWEVYLSPTWFGMLVFRNARALMTNAVKHAKARKVTLSMDRRAGALRIRVRDDGIGFDPRELANRPGGHAAFGLFSIRERMADLSGSLEIASGPGAGTEATLTAPLDRLT